MFVIYSPKNRITTGLALISLFFMFITAAPSEANPLAALDDALLGILGDNADNPPPPCPGDLNKDGVVDGEDLAIIADNFGEESCAAGND